MTVILPFHGANPLWGAGSTWRVGTEWDWGRYHWYHWFSYSLPRDKKQLIHIGIELRARPFCSLLRRTGGLQCKANLAATARNLLLLVMGIMESVNLGTIRELPLPCDRRGMQPRSVAPWLAPIQNPTCTCTCARRPHLHLPTKLPGQPPRHVSVAPSAFRAPPPPPAIAPSHHCIFRPVPLSATSALSRPPSTVVSSSYSNLSLPPSTPSP